MPVQSYSNKPITSSHRNQRTPCPLLTLLKIQLPTVLDLFTLSQAQSPHGPALCVMFSLGMLMYVIDKLLLFSSLSLWWCVTTHFLTP